METNSMTDAAVLAYYKPMRGFHRQGRFNVYAYDGRHIGDVWAFTAKDAAAQTGAAFAKFWH
jgi:hypothetical protein